MKNKFISAFFLLLSLSVVFSSCKKEEEPAPNNTTESVCTHSFTYLQVGDSLRYSMVNFGSTYTVYCYTVSNPSVNVFLFRTHFVENNFTADRYFKGCNGWLRDDVSVNVTDSLHYIKENRVVGDTWVYYDPQYQTYNEHVVLEKNVSVVTPAGTFSCDKISMHQYETFNTDTIWWNNSIGIVKYSGFALDYILNWKNF